VKYNNFSFTLAFVGGGAIEAAAPQKDYRLNFAALSLQLLV